MNARFYKFIALIGVILDMGITLIGVGRFGINTEANSVIRFILKNNLTYWYFTYGIMYYSLLYFYIDVSERVWHAIDRRISGLRGTLLKYGIEYFVIMVAITGYVGGFSWIWTIMSKNRII